MITSFLCTIQTVIVMWREKCFVFFTSFTSASKLCFNTSRRFSYVKLSNRWRRRRRRSVGPPGSLWWSSVRLSWLHTLSTLESLSAASTSATDTRAGLVHVLYLHPPDLQMASVPSGDVPRHVPRANEMIMIIIMGKTANYFLFAQNHMEHFHLTSFWFAHIKSSFPPTLFILVFLNKWMYLQKGHRRTLISFFKQLNKYRSI